MTWWPIAAAADGRKWRRAPQPRASGSRSVTSCAGQRRVAPCPRGGNDGGDASLRPPHSLRFGPAPFRPVLLVAVDDTGKRRQPRVAADRPEFVGRLPQPSLVERAWIDVDLIRSRIVRVDLRAAGRTEISPPMLRACEDIDLSRDRHRIG